jgi:hypothetical protein
MTNFTENATDALAGLVVCGNWSANGQGGQPIPPLFSFVVNESIEIGNALAGLVRLRSFRPSASRQSVLVGCPYSTALPVVDLANQNALARNQNALTMP